MRGCPGLTADRRNGHGRGAGPPLRCGGHRTPLPVRARCFGDAVPGASEPQHASPRELQDTLEDARSGAHGVHSRGDLLTSSGGPEDVRMAHKLGANSYLDRLSDEVSWQEGVVLATQYQ